MCEDEIDIPIQPERDPGLEGLRSCWTELALGIAIHRYFLHIDPVLTSETGFDWAARKTVVNSATESNSTSSKFLVAMHQHALQFVNCNEIADVKATGLSHQIASGPIRELVELGAPLVFRAETALPFNPWSKIAGAVHIPSRFPEKKAARLLVAGAMRNLLLAFLYAERREAGDVTPAEELTNTISDQCQPIVAKIEQIGPPIAGFASASLDLNATRSEIALFASTIVNMPARDLLETLAQAPALFSKYTSGLGVGQS